MNSFVDALNDVKTNGDVLNEATTTDTETVSRCLYQNRNNL